jgi:NitT/TauT family transport system substrate-binding protein
VRVASQNAAGDVLIYYAADRGFYEQEGLDVEIVPFANPADLTPALATEQVDIAGIGGTAPMWNAIARGVPLRLVLDKGSFKPGADFGAVVVRKDLYDSGRVRRLDDLRGLTVSLVPPGRASGNGAFLALGLQPTGLTMDDLNIQPLPFPDMVPALANGAVDAAVLAEPFVYLTTSRQGTAVKLVGNAELVPNYTISALCFSPTLYANRPAARAYARAYVRAARDYLAALAAPPDDPARLRVAEVIAGFSKLDVATVREMVPVGFSPNALPNHDSLVYAYRYFREVGMVPEPIPEAAFEAIWGTELLDDVLRELGRLPES